MAPGADAVGLIHRQSHQAALTGMAFQHLSGGFALQSLRRQVKQAKGFITQPGHRLLTAFRRQTGMQTSRSNAPPLQLQNLILHQGHQRRDHHHQSPADQRRQLITKGLTTACREHSQGVAPGQNRLNNGFLTTAKG